MHRFFYYLLFVILGGSFGLFAYNILSTGSIAWETYGKVYIWLLISYTWFTLLILCYASFRERKFRRYYNEPIAVLIPTYNERPELLQRTIDSVVKAKGLKRIIVIDDGSETPVHVRGDVSLIRFPTNRGKRHALYAAVKELPEFIQYVVTIDSDTVLDARALVRVVEPLKSPHVGASTGDVRLLNEKENWLTRMVGTYYWIGLNIYKEVQSAFGHVVCCSGCLAAYRADILKEIIDEFANQKFLGEACTHSEDRHLTNLVLKRGFDVVYAPKAVCWTETPSTVRGFLRQQQRWKRGFIRESTYTLTYAWKTRPILFLQILFWDLTAPFLTFGMRLAVILSIFLAPTFFVTTIVPGWIVFMLVRYSIVVFREPKKIAGLFTYALFYEVFLYWMNIYALVTVKNKSWITR